MLAGQCIRSSGRRVALAATFLSVALSAGGALAQSGQQGCDEGERRIRFSHVTSPTGSPKGEAATRLAQLVNERLDGRVCMEVYPNSELFNDNQVMEALLKGEVELAAPATSKIDGLVPEFQIFSLPFIFQDTTALQWFQNSGAGVRLRRTTEKAGYVGLAYWNNGMRQMSATRPLLKPSDAKGLVFRVSGSEAQQATYTAVGATAKKISFKKVYAALENGEVQGQENSWANILTKKFYEVQDGVTESNHNVSLYLLVTSKRFWDSLDRADRPKLKAIIAQVSAEQNRAVEEHARLSRLELENLGVEIRKLSREDRAAWVEQMRPVWDKFRDVIGDQLLEAAVSANR